MVTDQFGSDAFQAAGAALQGRKVRFAPLLTMGECWHNNHHAYPGTARLGLYPGEWDPGWWALLLLRRCRLAWHIHLPAQLPDRAAPGHGRCAAHDLAHGHASATGGPRHRPEVRRDHDLG